MPEQKKRLFIDVLVLLLIILSAAAFVLTRLVPQGRTVWLLVGWLGIFAMLYTVTRYRISLFIYVVCPRGEAEAEAVSTYAGLGNVPVGLLDLRVLKILPWGSSTAQCVLSLEDLCSTVFIGRDGQRKREICKEYRRENGGRFPLYDYTLTPASADRLILIFDDGQRYIGVMLEVEGEMRELFETVG